MTRNVQLLNLIPWVVIPSFLIIGMMGFLLRRWIVRPIANVMSYEPVSCRVSTDFTLFMFSRYGDGLLGYFGTWYQPGFLELVIRGSTLQLISRNAVNLLVRDKPLPINPKSRAGLYLEVSKTTVEVVHCSIFMVPWMSGHGLVLRGEELGQEVTVVILFRQRNVFEVWQKLIKAGVRPVDVLPVPVPENQYLSFDSMFNARLPVADLMAVCMVVIVTFLIVSIIDNQLAKSVLRPALAAGVVTIVAFATLGLLSRLIVLIRQVKIRIICKV